MSDLYTVRTLLSLSATFLVSVYLLRVLRPIAHRIDLVDHPDVRKTHGGQVALIGGVGIFLGVVSGLMLSPFGLGEFRLFILCCGILMVTGILDDHKDISPLKKIIVQFLIAGLLTMADGLVVTDIGDIWNWRDGNELGTGVLAIPLSVIAIVGVLNSLNMVDGHDGLAGSMFVLSGVALMIFCQLSGFTKHQHILALFVVGTVAFLIFNFPSGRADSEKVFLGDAGSLLLGLVLAFFLILITEENNSLLKTVSAPWIIGVPLLDLMGVICLRAIARQSLIKADRRHLHHFLGDLGMGKIEILVVIGILQGIFVGVGLAGSLLDWPDPFLFWPMFAILFSYIVLRKQIGR